MDVFPNEEDEFEMLYSQELDMMRELESGIIDINDSGKATTKKRLFTEEIDCNTGIQQTNNFNEDSNDSGKTTTKKRLITEEIDCNTGSQPTNNFNEASDESGKATTKKRLFTEEIVYNTGSQQTNNFNENFSNGSKRKKLTLPMVGLFESLAKKKSKFDPDLDLINRIVLHRQEMVEEMNKTVADLKVFSYKKNSSTGATIQSRIPHGDFQSITTSSGERYYLDFLKEEVFDMNVANSVKNSDIKMQLLSQPYSTIFTEAQRELLLMKSRNEEPEGSLPSKVNGDVTEIDSRVEDDIENTKELWVEKYRPRSYLDLLSDECTNRTVLHWIKLWDKVVFGRERKTRVKEKQQNLKGAGNKPFFVKKVGPEVIEEFDEIGRPQQKVLLLCGPPGLGKTTLAHIIARHAGYNVVEMNASDDRSIEVFKTNLQNATSMKAVFGQDRKPNCLIIDEIDGAPAPAINFLVNVLQGKKTKGDLKAKKREEVIILRRPVICICNNLYSLSLRPLRLMALIIPFPPTLSARLAQRLFTITRQQSLKADLSVLMALCNKTENDIRSCLSVLQFVRSSTAELKFLDLEGVSIGQKDYQRSLFSVWNDIFTIPRAKRQHHTNPHKLALPSKGKHILVKPDNDKSSSGQESIDCTSLAGRFNHILKAAYSCGEYEKVTNGWFENYLHMKFKHVHMEAVVSGLAWTTLTDLLQDEIHRNQNWMLNCYIPYSFVAYHYLFATHGKSSIQFPKQFTEHATKLNQSKSLLTMMLTGMSANTLFYCPKLTLVLDILPYLNIIAQPPLRPVNIQLYSSNEKKDLGLLVDMMISYNLTYQQTRSLEGQYSFNLEPNIEEIVRFSEIPACKTISYSAKQLIAREIELEKMRRSEKYFESHQKEVQARNPTIMPIEKNSNLQKSSSSKPSVTQAENSKQPLPNHLQKLSVKKFVNKEFSTVAKDFFGREITNSKATAAKGHKKDILTGDIWFKFKEGYSNAVRRTVRVRDFF